MTRQLCKLVYPWERVSEIQSTKGTRQLQMVQANCNCALCDRCCAPVSCACMQHPASVQSLLCSSGIETVRFCEILESFAQSRGRRRRRLQALASQQVCHIKAFENWETMKISNFKDSTRQSYFQHLQPFLAMQWQLYMFCSVSWSLNASAAEHYLHSVYVMTLDMICMTVRKCISHSSGNLRSLPSSQFVSRWTVNNSYKLTTLW